MSLSKNRGEDARLAGRHELRRRIEVLFPTVADLNAFVVDYFSEVGRQYSADMSRTHRVNLLLEIETPAKVAKSLRCFHKEKQSALSPPAPQPKKKNKVSPPVHVRLRPLPGETTIELLGALEQWCRDHCAESLLVEHRALHAEPISNGWRRLALQLSANSVALEAFPALLDPGGSPEPKLRVQVARGMTKEASYIYLPLGRGGREYRVFLTAGSAIRVSLELKDQPGRIIFEAAESAGADREVLHGQ